MAICAVLSVYSAAIGINKPAIGTFFAVGIVGATLVSFGLGRVLAGTKIFRLDGILYFVAALIVIFRANPLNSMLPDEGYPFQLIVAGVLSWMLLFGSVVAWRDTTQVFQMVPCIALFGLVGAWNTFENAKYMFLVFMICAATLFARSHMRAMLRQAELSEGPQVVRVSRFMGDGSGEAEAEEEEAERFRTLRTGPWRWMAGPEWALVSALAVVLFSLVGAPVIQSSVSAVSGQLRVDVPYRRPTATTSANFAAGQGSMRVGNGPRGQIEGRPVLLARLDHPRYLRGRTYYRYEMGSWSNDVIRPEYYTRGRDGIAESILREEVASLRNPSLLEFDLHYLFGRHDRIYIPGQPLTIADRRPFLMTVDGMVINVIESGPPFTISGTSLVPDESEIPKTTAIPSYLLGRADVAGDFAGLPPRVKDFAERAIVGARTDYEKAMAIKLAIERQVKYNLNAEKPPEGQDPVDAFLFQVREGYCDLFASAMALAARSVGLPARTVTGFFPVLREKDAEGYYTLRDADFHMWCEIYFEGFGWVPFDPTEGAASVPGGERGAVKGQTKAWYEQPWVRQAIDIGLIVLGVAVLLLALRGIFTKKPSHVVVERTAVGRLYARFSHELERRTGKPRRLNETPHEYLERIKEHLSTDGLRESAGHLTGKFEEALYSPVAPTPADLKDLGASIQAFRKSAA